MNVFQGQALTVFFQLKNAGTGVPGLVPADVTLRWWKAGLINVPVRPILPEEWVDLGDGYYTLTLPKEDVDQLGKLYLKFSGGTFDVTEKGFVVEPAPIAFLASPNTCIVSGNTLDLAGRLLSGKEIVFRGVDAPNAVGPSIVNFDRIITYTDAMGNFSVNLLRGAKAIVEIKEAGLRAQFEVPDQSTALLLDLLPPIP